MPAGSSRAAGDDLGSKQFADRQALTGWFGKLVDTIGRENLKELHDTFGPLPDLARPKDGYRARLVQLFRDNIKAAFTVALVSIPLALSLAVTAGASPNMGLASATWGMLIAGLLGGSQFNVAGPTASGASIMAIYSLRYGYEILPFIAILAGVLLIFALAFRLDKYVMLIPHCVLTGWTLGVAFTIGGNQLSYAFGVLNFPQQGHFMLNIYEIFAHMNQIQVGGLITFIIAVVVLVVCGHKLPKYPWIIIVAIVGMLLGLLADNHGWFYSLTTLNALFPKLGFNPFKTPTLRGEFFTTEIIIASFQAAFICLVETLISARVADRLTDTRFAQPLEVFGIAIANIVSGVFNGIPVTCALSRTTLNVNSGATNRTAAIMGGLIVGVLSWVLISLIGYVPICVIAALLWIVAIRMVNVSAFTHLWISDPTSFRIAIFTTLVTVFWDPAQGIIYGAVVSIFIHGLRTSEAWSEITLGKDDKVVLTLSSIQVDRQALQDTFARQFPPTLHEDDENGLRHAVEMEEQPQHDQARMSIDSADRNVALDTDLDLVEDALDPNSELDPSVHMENRVFITAPKYDADHMLIRIPGMLTYLNAQQHADRIAPLLGTGRWLILHLKRTYYIDLDGMDILSSIVRQIERGGQKLLVAGFTPQILPNLEQLEWFIRARDENRIAPDYKSSIRHIRDLDLAEQKRREELEYHDITAFELQERERHFASIAVSERERLEEERRVKAAAEEAREDADKQIASAAAREQARVQAVAKHQAELAARRKADAEEFQRRLVEFEEKKKGRENAKAAYMAAASEADIVGEPSITIPHHHDHHQPPLRKSYSTLKLSETPVQHEPVAAPSAPAPVVHATPSEPAPAPKEEAKPEQHHHVEETPKHVEETPQPEKSHVEVETPKETPSVEPVVETLVIEEPTPVVEATVQIDETPVESTPAAQAHPEPVIVQPSPEPTPAEPTPVEPAPVSSEASLREPSTSSSPAPVEEATVPPTPPPTEASEISSPTEEPASSVDAPSVAEPAVTPSADPFGDFATENAGTSAHSLHQEHHGGSAPSTPPPESEASSIASDGPGPAPLSPRMDYPEPQAPLDLADPFADTPEGDNMVVEESAQPSAATQSAEHSQPSPVSHTPEPAHTSEPVAQPVAPAQPQETPAPASVDFIDPFADILGDVASTSVSAPATPAKEPVAAAATPLSSQPTTVDYIDPFADFESQPAPVAHAAPAHTSEPAPSSSADPVFDPFAELITTTDHQDKESDEELLL